MGVMLTAKSEESDTVVGLELGADDYVGKPFSPRALMARIKALFRRLERSDDLEINTYRYGILQLNPSRHEVTVDGDEVVLTAKEFGLLEHLLRNPGRVLTRDVLLNSVWGYDYHGTTRTVDVHDELLRYFQEMTFGNVHFIEEAIHTNVDGRRLLVTHGLPVP